MPDNVSHSVPDQDWKFGTASPEQTFLLRDNIAGQAAERYLFDQPKYPYTEIAHQPARAELRELVRGQSIVLRELARGQSIVKRVFDVSASILAILLLTPVWLTIISILTLQKGPILFVQDRIGKGGQIFRCYKFRTMMVGADAMLAKVLAGDRDKRAEWHARRKLARDPRITALGKVLRRTSLDELPQLLNIIKGDMSLVGPRPIVRSELYKYRGFYTYYLSVRPGLTGFWQVNGHNSTTYHRRVALDVAYVNKFSLALDAKIIALTLPALFRTDEIS